MTTHRFIRSAALGLTVAALAAPAAVARPADFRSPDTRDAGNAAIQQDQPRQDLRTPDARDQAAGRGTFTAPEVTVVKVAEPAPAATGGGLDWGDAGLGAGGMLGLVLVGVASVLAVVHRRKGSRHGRPAVTA